MKVVATSFKVSDHFPTGSEKIQGKFNHKNQSPCQELDMEHPNSKQEWKPLNHNVWQMAYHFMLQPTIELLHVVMQESQQDAHDSSKDWEVVHRFQFRDVQHYDMLEAAAL